MPIARIAFSNAGSRALRSRVKPRAASTRWLSVTSSPAYQQRVLMVAPLSVPAVTELLTAKLSVPGVASVPSTVIVSLPPFLATTVKTPLLPVVESLISMVAPTGRLAKHGLAAEIVAGGPAVKVRPPVVAWSKLARRPTCASGRRVDDALAVVDRLELGEGIGAEGHRLRRRPAAGKQVAAVVILVEARLQRLQGAERRLLQVLGGAGVEGRSAPHGDQLAAEILHRVAPG